MRQIIILTSILLFTASVFAQEPLLPAGKYLFISNRKDGVDVQKCEITNGKEGTFLVFPPPPKDPDYALKPLRVYAQDDQFLIIAGPGDFVQPPKKSGLSVTILRGQVSDGVPKGTVLYNQSASADTFMLYKE